MNSICFALFITLNLMSLTLCQLLKQSGSVVLKICIGGEACLDNSESLLIGLGDIVIPGIFIALLRRFDHYIGSGGNYKKPRHYFLITTAAYCFGLMITIGVMHFFKVKLFFYFPSS